jgi:serine/threonine protein kinase
MANVDALSDMSYWRIDAEAFDSTCEDYPQLREILTELVAERLSGALLGGDRAVGKYLVGKPIGHGGWSVVYQGAHSNLDMPVAIKMLKHSIAMDTQFVDQFRQEARTVAQLNHENIVKVYDVEELYRTFFIIMELVEGESLETKLQYGRKMSLSEKLDILMQTCAGLIHAHSKQVIHKDIKPSNILVRNDGKVKLVDFGFAGATGVKDEVVRGSVSYIAPEQIKRSPVDERTDVYSVGIMAYEALTGVKPCAATTRGEVVCWHLEQDLKDPGDANPELPDDLRAFVRKATRRAPKNRYQNCAQALHDLVDASRRLGVEPRRAESTKLNMMNLFLLYRQEQQQIIQRIVKDFSRELEKVGARLRGTDFKDILD